MQERLSNYRHDLNNYMLNMIHLINEFESIFLLCVYLFKWMSSGMEFKRNACNFYLASRFKKSTLQNAIPSLQANATSASWTFKRRYSALPSCQASKEGGIVFKFKEQLKRDYTLYTLNPRVSSR